MSKTKLFSLLLFWSLSIMLFSHANVFNLNISVYKVKQETIDNKLVWICWRIPEVKTTFLIKNAEKSLNKSDNQFSDIRTLHLCDINWNHLRSDEEVVPRKLNFIIYDGSVYLCVFESFKGKYSFKVLREFYKLSNQKLIRHPQKGEIVFEKKDIDFDDKLCFSLGENCKYQVKLKLSKVGGNPKKLVKDMSFVISQFGMDFFDAFKEDNGSKIEEILIDANFGFYGKFSEIVNIVGSYKRTGFLKKVFDKVTIDRIVGVPDKFYLRSKFFFLRKD